LIRNKKIIKLKKNHQTKKHIDNARTFFVLKKITFDPSRDKAQLRWLV
jgi:hypothetical protein